MSLNNRNVNSPAFAAAPPFNNFWYEVLQTNWDSKHELMRMCNTIDNRMHLNTFSLSSSSCWSRR